MSLCRLIYKSKYEKPINQEIIESIEGASQKNNERLGITGMLIGNKSGFMQVLEGDVDAVAHVFNNICKDNRHSNIKLVSYDLIPQRAFPDWAMKCVAIGLMGRILAQRLKQKYGEQDSDLVLPSDGHKAFALLFDLAFLLKNNET